MKKEKAPSFIRNSELAQISHEAENPYHHMHVAKAYELKQPKTGFSAPKHNDFSPWATLTEGKKK